MKILVLLPRFPYPLDKGDKLRAYHQLVELSKRHDIHLFALSHEPVGQAQLEALKPYCKSIHVERLPKLTCGLNVLRAFLHGQSLQIGYWTTRRAKKAYVAFVQQVQPDIIYRQMIRTMKYSGGGVLDFQDALSLNTQRRMERSHGLLKMILRYEYRALQRAEQEALCLFDATTVISPVDQAALAPTVALIPNGVDTDYYNATHYPLSTTHSICFTGNMSYAPNVDAARWLVKEIMPLVWEQCPYGINVLIAGAGPKPAVKALAGPKVTVSGRLGDIRTAYASAKMFVAPMRIGSGMQNKLLESMAMGLPCVTTTLANTPLGTVAGEQMLVGDTPEELSQLIISLLTDTELCKRIADAGHRFVLEHHSWHAAVAPLEALLNQSNN